MRKSEVYRLRVSPHRKSELEEVARREHQTVAKLLERIVEEWLRSPYSGVHDRDEQRRLQSAAARAFGKIRSGDRTRSRRVKHLVRARLRERRARQGPHRHPRPGTCPQSRLRRRCRILPAR